MTHPISYKMEPRASELPLPPIRSFQQMVDELKRKVSKSELNAQEGLTNVLYNSRLERGSDAYNLEIVEMFASPKYSEAYKRYSAAKHLYDELIFSAADQFLTEGIILSRLQLGAGRHISMDYFKAMMGSAHLSERIMEAGFERVDATKLREILTPTPDAMVTPRVMNSWLATVERWYQDGFKVAAPRIRAAHPEYEEFPDEWVIKVFCGG